MYLLQSWKDSLSLFKPKNFKLFALVTLKTIGQTYRLLLKYFWWIALLYVAVHFINISATVFGISLQALATAFLLFIWFFVSCLIVRPSISQKNYAYFHAYLAHALSVALGIFVLFIPFMITQELFFLDFSPFPLHNEQLIFLFTFMSQVSLPPLILFFVFFVLDMPLGFKNWYKAQIFAEKMLIYNAPALVILGIVLFGSYTIVEYIFSSACILDLCRYPMFKYLFYFLPEPILASVMCNFYVKRLHEQPQLYFKQPKEQE
jgi:hypothetical protein